MPACRLPFSNFRGFAQRRGQQTVESQTVVYLPRWSSALLAVAFAGMAVNALAFSIPFAVLVAVLGAGILRDSLTSTRRGTFLFDGLSKTLDWERNGERLGKFAFSDIKELRTCFDWIGPFGRLRWLVVHLRDGGRVFIASGSRRELESLRALLSGIGVPGLPESR